MTMSDEELSRRVAAAYDDVIEELVPERLSSLLAPGKAAHMNARRERRGRPWAGPLTWAQLGGIAAGVLFGIAVGWQVAPSEDALVMQRDGGLVAGSALARALDSQLAADGGDVTIHLTFADREGRYCRTFTARQLAGLACRDGGDWAVMVTARGDAPPAGGMRQAATALPRPVLDAVDARIAGTAFDAAKETQARDRRWAR
jgi:hypothetical protein